MDVVPDGVVNVLAVVFDSTEKPVSR